MCTAIDQDTLWYTALSGLYGLPIEEIQGSIEFLTIRVGKVQAIVTMLRLLPRISEVADKVLPLQIFGYVSGFLEYIGQRNIALSEELPTTMHDLASIYLGNVEMLEIVLSKMFMVLDEDRPTK